MLEFYASTEAGAILVNLSGSKAGSMGRPLPGSTEVRIAAYDVESRTLALGAEGFARRSAVDETGMLLARVRAGEPTSTTPLRGVFARDDAWLATNDLFRRDADGDYWRVDSARDVIRTATGPVFPGPVRDALGDLPAVDLAVAYGVLPRGGEREIAVAAVTLRSGHELQGRDIARAHGPIPSAQWPAIVRVVDQIPVTTWFRPITGPLREAGIPEPRAGTQAWYLDASGDTYRSLTGAAHRRFVGQAA